MDDDQQKNSSNVGWKYTAADDNPVSADGPEAKASSQEPLKPVVWSELESFSEKKTVGWYLILIILTVLLSGLTYLLTKDRLTTAVIIICGVLFGVYGTRKPKTINYTIDERGFKIGSRSFNFSSYKSFSIISIGDNMSAALVPLHRFMPYTYINFSADMVDKVLPVLDNSLPREAARRDLLERFFRRVGF